jgi:ABC-type dipeptide/oligopeptide/nickel transport system ATPase component
VRPVVRLHAVLQLPAESVSNGKRVSESMREFTAAQAKAAAAAAKQKAEAERLQLELLELGVSPLQIKQASESLKRYHFRLS